MSDQKSRPLSYTEQNWCRAVSSGTGITILALQITNTLSKPAFLHKILQNLHKSHPILRSKLHYNAVTKNFTFLKSTIPQIQIQFHDHSKTQTLLKTLMSNEITTLPESQLILEHELNTNKWTDFNSFPCNGIDAVSTNVYALSELKSMIVLTLHTSVCDRTTAVTLLRELLELVEGEGVGKGIENDGEGNFGIESIVPSGMGKKTVWARGRDMLGYSMSSLMLTNLKFCNTKGARRSQILRLQMDSDETSRLLDGCKSRGIKLCGALTAASLIAAHSTKLNSDQLKKKYGVVTLTDCRSQLVPPLTPHHFGFYTSAVLNVHTVKGNDTFWDLAERCYTEFANSKKSNKHFTDMADLNFLMVKAMENPSLTPSSSLRTSLITVFEEPVIDNSIENQQKIGVFDYVGCASLHGVGPSIAFFETIRDEAMDCACVYPAPLHSREQMSKLVDEMKRILIHLE